MICISDFWERNRGSNQCRISLSENEKPEKKEGISVWIRGNFFIPDARRFWIKPSVRFLRKYLQENPVDAIISTGPPHSMHLIAWRLKKHFNIPWIADFRDPWTEIDFYNQLRLTRRSDQKHKTQEKAVLTWSQQGSGDWKNHGRTVQGGPRYHTCCDSQWI